MKVLNKQGLSFFLIIKNSDFHFWPLIPPAPYGIAGKGRDKIYI
jgi:hypothetical protein